MKKPTCAAEQNAMSRCTTDHFHRKVACGDCKPRLRKEVRKEAQETWADDDLEVYDDAEVLPAQDGSWVAAWVWVPNEKES